jgi:LysM repeat protein
MQADAYTDVYDDNWESTYEYVATTCNLTVADFNATASVFNVTVPTSSPNCVSEVTYTTAQGDTCDSIAMTFGVSAATMYYNNPDIANCSSIIPGTDLCLPLACNDIYTVQPNDTCVSIAIANSISPQNLLAYNSQLNSNCTNLQSTNPYWGSTLCVSTPGGTYTGQALNTSSSTGSEVVSPPTGATVASGTVTDCGAWFVMDASQNLTCAQICLSNEIAINLFTEANPSLNKATCDSDLVDGDAYCVSPLTGWDWGTNSTNTTSTSTLSSSSLSTSLASTTTTIPTSTITTGDGITTPTPHQTGMVADCNKFYLVVDGDECGTIAASEGISLADFYSWNPAVGTDCAYLDLNDYVCVDVTPSATTSASATPAATVPSNGIPTPTPYQTGMTPNCDNFHLVISGDECSDIATDYGISLDDFYEWNPAVGSSCQYLGLNDYACVGVAICTSTSILAAAPEPKQGLTCGSPGASHDDSGSLLLTSYTESPYVDSAAACGALCLATPSCTNLYFMQGSYCNLHEGASTFAESTVAPYYLWYDVACFSGEETCGALGASHDDSGSLLLTSYTTSPYVDSAADCGAQCLTTSSCTNLYFIQGSYCNLHEGDSTFAESTVEPYYSWYSASCFSSGQACGSYGFSQDSVSTVLVSYTDGSPYVASAAACGAQCLATAGCTNVYFIEGSFCNLHTPSTFGASTASGYYSWYQAGCFACDAYDV